MLHARTRFALLASAIVVAAGSAVLIAGPLDPPAGPVGSTLKTLAEVQPRTIVNQTNTPGDADSVFRISQPGSYYLTANMLGVAAKHGIEIESDGVTLDLCGFEALGVAGTLDGVRIVPGHRGITVRDGTLQGWKGAGLSAVGGPNADACLYQDLRLVGNGTDENSYALDVGGASTVVNCVTISNLGTGIRGNNGTLISDSAATSNGADGIICGAGTVRDCLARGNAIDGIRVGAASVVTGCSATANAGAGITIHFGSLARGNACFGNGWGMFIFGDGSTMEGNTIYANAVGLEVTHAGNFVYRNTFRANTSTLVVAPGNDVGPLGSAAASVSPWANLSQ